MKYKAIAKKILGISDDSELIIDEIVKCFLDKNDIDYRRINCRNLSNTDTIFSQFIRNELLMFDNFNTVEDVIDIIEAVIGYLIDDITGIVFTPKYISDFMIEQSEKLTDNSLVIDPGCGGGIFLVSAADKIHKISGKNYRNIVEDNLYGIDIKQDYVNATKVILEIVCLLNGEDTRNIKFNIKKGDTLKETWDDILGVNKFDLIVGNPPYYNTHDMTTEEIQYLKTNFSTTKNGVFNVFYAFIEESYKHLKQSGELIFIIPNNFLTIKSAMELRKFFLTKKTINKIIDFGDNMIFKPIRTYSCIIRLDRNQNNIIQYINISKTNNISYALNNIGDFDSLDVNILDAHRWHLIDCKTRENINKIESKEIKVGNYIRTGIATLRDEVYIASKDQTGYYKEHQGKRYDLDEGLIRVLYKVPELKKANDIADVKRYIIFPYEINGDKVATVSEEKMIVLYNKTYSYLIDRKNELDQRDKGKKYSAPWYAYGRSQGLNKFGKKLLFPTFADKPKFVEVKDQFSLFCNGYALFDDIPLDLKIVKKILNSFVMEYYIKNTSYPIDGGYFCYQKKYIENFSIPLLNDDDKKMIINSSTEELNKFLIEKYDLEL